MSECVLKVHHEGGECWIRSYDVDASGGRGHIEFTVKKSDAMRFADPGAAIAAWQTQSTKKPLRSDGRPNRPLTAFTVEIESRHE